KEKYYAWIRSINQWSSERSELGATTPLSLTAGGTRVSAFGATTPTVWNTAWRGARSGSRLARRPHRPLSSLFPSSWHQVCINPGHDEITPPQAPSVWSGYMITN